MLIPTVQGKSLDGKALPHFGILTSPAPQPIHETPWRLGPLAIDPEYLQALEIERWNFVGAAKDIEEFVESFTSYFAIVDHLADLVRGPEPDALGEEIVANYQSTLKERIDDSIQELEAIQKVISAKLDAA